MGLSNNQEKVGYMNCNYKNQSTIFKGNITMDQLKTRCKYNAESQLTLHTQVKEKQLYIILKTVDKERAPYKAGLTTHRPTPIKHSNITEKNPIRPSSIQVISSQRRIILSNPCLLNELTKKRQRKPLNILKGKTVHFILQERQFLHQSGYFIYF